jgi:hypothetical protein
MKKESNELDATCLYIVIHEVRIPFARHDYASDGMLHEQKQQACSC